MIVVAGTGHRKLGGSYELDTPVARSVREVTRAFLVEREVDHVITGMALGFDTILALTAIELKLSVLAAIPFEGQESRWPEESQRRYREILANPLISKWVTAQGGYNNHKLQVRNELMVKRCDLLLACWDGSYGGTKNCVDYAFHVGKPVVRLRPGSTKIEELRQHEE
jgi:uncharacterized phage-like protein YoqJ